MPSIIFPRTTEEIEVTISGPITVTTEPYTEGLLEAEWELVTDTGATVIPNSKGAFVVEVQNISGTEPNTEFGNILVNGDTVAPGGVWSVEMKIDYTTEPPTQCFTPEVTVTIGDDMAFRYRVTRKA